MNGWYLFGLPFTNLSIAGEDVEVLVDTGFNGSVLLSREKAQELQLQKDSMVKCVMADGSVFTADRYLAEITWFDKIRNIEVLAVDSDFALLGMQLLRDACTILNPRKHVLRIEPA